MERNKEIDSSIVRQMEIVFDEVEMLQNIIGQAKIDRRYRWTLADARFTRDTIEKIERMLEKAWLLTLDIAVEVDIEEARERLRKAMERCEIENQDTVEQKALNGEMTYPTLERLLAESVIENNN